MNDGSERQAGEAQRYSGGDQFHVLTISLAGVDFHQVQEIAIYPNMYNGEYCIDRIRFVASEMPAATVTPADTPTPTVTRSPTPASTATQNPSSTLTPIPTATSTATPTATSTQIFTPTSTPSVASTPTRTPTPTRTQTPQPGEIAAAIAIGVGPGAPVSGYRIFEPGGGKLDSRVNAVTRQRASIDLAAGDLRPEIAGDELVTGTGRRTDDRGLLTVIDMVRRAQLNDLFPFPSRSLSFDVNPGNEIFVAAGNLFGDAIPEILAAQGVGSEGRFRIIPYVNNQLVNLQGNTFRATGLGTPPGGISIAAGDIDSDGYDEIVAGQLGSPREGAWDAAYIQALNINDPSRTRDPNAPIDGNDINRSRRFGTFGKTTNPSGAVRVAAGDLDADGIDEIVVVTARLEESLADGLSRVIVGGNRIMVLEPNFTDTGFSSGSFSVAVRPSGSPVSMRLFSERQQSERGYLPRRWRCGPRRPR